jgi:predicted CXXCH cytochrome family protein
LTANVFPSVISALFLLLVPVLASAGPGNEGSMSLPEAKKDCAACHKDIAHGPALHKPLSRLCLDCHPDRKAPAEHAVDIVPSMPVRQLPLSSGKITCLTCHDPHSNSNGKLLRVPARDLCTHCHSY